MSDEQCTHKEGKTLKCTLYPLGQMQDYEYVVICAYHGGKYLLSRHKNRTTWEHQGGHIECGETPIEAARRELFEESGTTDATLIPLCDYDGYDTKTHAHGQVFLAIVHEFSPLPDFEMAEVACFSQLPTALTYPEMTPVFFAYAREYLAKNHI